jgi:hypothetical protein
MDPHVADPGDRWRNYYVGQDLTVYIYADLPIQPADK